MGVELQRVVLAAIQCLNVMTRPARPLAVAPVDGEHADVGILAELGERLVRIFLPTDSEAESVGMVRLGDTIAKRRDKLWIAIRRDLNKDAAHCRSKDGWDYRGIPSGPLRRSPLKRPPPLREIDGVIEGLGVGVGVTPPVGLSPGDVGVGVLDWLTDTTGEAGDTAACAGTTMLPTIGFDHAAGSIVTPTAAVARACSTKRRDADTRSAFSPSDVPVGFVSLTHILPSQKWTRPPRTLLVRLYGVKASEPCTELSPGRRATVKRHLSATPTIVTALLDLGRDSLADGFKRPYDEYLSHLPAVLSVGCPMVIHADAAAEALVWQHRSPDDTVVHRCTVSNLERFPWWGPVQAIRTTPAWRGQAGWLADSPQAQLPAYNPLVMSKLPWLADVARANPFHTSTFVWMDSGLGRTVPASMLQTACASDALHAYLTRFLFLCYPYEHGPEIHGFPRPALAQRAGVAQTRWVARGGFFGGTASFVQKARAIYDILLAETLAEGLMGTEESLFTIMGHLHPAIFERFPVGEDGLVWPFFHHVSQDTPNVVS